ncbi:MAG TPA: carboxymuconolactone decarboxylase family protein [Xanthobacteraceae bacterium]|nr:carboxymuconolactone decarboxylase family protein [Xanthobacteraceae bacterium]
MARVPYAKREDLTEGQRPIYDRMERERGVPTANIFLALANVPHLLDPILSLAGALRKDTVIERRFRELGILMVGLVTNCAYEFDHHWNAAIKAGVPKQQLEKLAEFQASPLFDAAERAVLHYAKEATESGEVADATWDELRRHFDLRQAMEIVLTVAWYNMVVRILLPLRIENEDWFKRL